MCVTITKGGKAITENRMYEKNGAHAELSECAPLCI